MERTTESTVLHLVKLRLLTDYPSQIAACLDALTEEQLWWRPNEQANAVGNLLVHLSWSNRYYLEEVIGGRDIGRDRDLEFTARGGVSKTEIRRAWTASVEVAGDVLDRLVPSMLMQTTDRTGKTTTFLQILLHVVHHNATHVGQVVWITKMLQPGRLDELWMHSRARVR